MKKTIKKKKFEAKLIDSFIVKNKVEIDQHLQTNKINPKNIISIIHLHELPSFDHYEIFYRIETPLMCSLKKFFTFF